MKWGVKKSECVCSVKGVGAVTCLRMGLEFHKDDRRTNSCGSSRSWFPLLACLALSKEKVKPSFACVIDNKKWPVYENEGREDNKT